LGGEARFGVGLIFLPSYRSGKISQQHLRVLFVEIEVACGGNHWAASFLS